MSKKKTLVVLFGGCSTEYEVSLQSACAVISNIDPVKYHVLTVGITREGDWYLYDGPAGKISDDTWHQEAGLPRAILSPERGKRTLIILQENGLREIPVDGIFPVLHGKNGEDGTVQGLAELAGIPVIGCDMLSSAVCMDKEYAHAIVRSYGIAVPEGFAVHNMEYDPTDVRRRADDLGYPLFVKPARAGSSFGITQVHGPASLPEAVAVAFAHDKKAVIEKSVEGVEVGCAVLGTQELFTGEVDEVILSDGFFNYTEKYTLQTSKINVPAHTDSETKKQIQQMAKKIYRVLGCSGFARVDLFLTPKNEIIFNEVNTIPGCTSHSRYPGMMQAAGIPFPRLIDKIIETAVTPE